MLPCRRCGRSGTSGCCRLRWSPSCSRRGVQRVIDVRFRPQSRRPGMSKTRLGDMLGDQGIAYEHRKALGTPPDLRHDFHAGRIERARAGYRAHVEATAPDELDAARRRARARAAHGAALPRGGPGDLPPARALRGCSRSGCRSWRSSTSSSWGVGQGLALFAREHPRAVDDHAPPAQPRQHRLLPAERDQRRVVAQQPELERARRMRLELRADPAVELDARAAVARIDRDRDPALVAGDQRRAAPAVRRERREHDPVRAGREHRTAGGERVRARAERRGDDQPVAGEADEQLAVDAHLGRRSGRRPGARSTTSLTAVSVSPPSDVQRQRGQQPRRPVARGDAVERVAEIVRR